MTPTEQPRPLAPGLYQLGHCLVLDVPELLQASLIADSEAAREAVCLAARLIATGLQLFARQVQTPALDGRPSWERATSPVGRES